MKTISLTEAHTLLESCSAVIIDNVVTYPSICSLYDKADAEAEDNEFLYLEWSGEKGQEFFVKFAQGPNEAGVKVQGGSMWLTDTDGDEYQISLLVPASLD